MEAELPGLEAKAGPNLGDQRMRKPPVPIAEDCRLGSRESGVVGMAHTKGPAAVTSQPRPHELLEAAYAGIPGGGERAPGSLMVTYLWHRPWQSPLLGYGNISLCGN